MEQANSTLSIAHATLMHTWRPMIQEEEECTRCWQPTRLNEQKRWATKTVQRLACHLSLVLAHILFTLFNLKRCQYVSSACDFSFDSETGCHEEK